MSLMPWFGGRGDPFSSDLFDPLGASAWPWDAVRRGGDDATAVARTNVDWHENEKEHIFSAEIPGVRKEDVKVEVEDGNVLKISGQKTREEEHKDDAWNRVERSFGSFMRRFRLPENAKAEGIKCTMQDGVLRVVVPKDEDAQKQGNVRSIDIA
ncbi:17.6 kDa class I heat shock protein 3-like [Lolium rigidum]|uniref:17.6 kDa class I heat shock protein 3-like n=1 Tax=Lolium rigidum TaxID=89674 RepID=UPI001F5E237B|nr:17.6 kDa class I heat shock protein 3-like [Lolium rigidum]